MSRFVGYFFFVLIDLRSPSLEPVCARARHVFGLAVGCAREVPHTWRTIRHGICALASLLVQLRVWGHIESSRFLNASLTQLIGRLLCGAWVLGDLFTVSRAVLPGVEAFYSCCIETTPKTNQDFQSLQCVHCWFGSAQLIGEIVNGKCMVQPRSCNASCVCSSGCSIQWPRAFRQTTIGD